MNNEIAIVVATHKMVPMPNDDMYTPLFMGAACKSREELASWNYERDDYGDNISKLNPILGTQTGLYWIWKNVRSEYKGLVHYRRFFIKKRKNQTALIQSVLKYDELRPMLGVYSVYVPRKRWYVLETLYSHYSHTHEEKHLIIARKLIEEYTPEYIQVYDKVLRRRWGYMFNMMILRNDLMEDYCTWLFKILFQMTERINTKGMSDFDKRYGGRISEILFNVWLEKKKEIGTIKTKEVKELAYIEDVDWGYKIKSFLKAKFLKKKYGRSS